MAKTRMKKIAELKEYSHLGLKRGYANQTLHIDVSRNEIEVKEVSAEMKAIFTGGTGYDLKLLWDAVRGTEHPDGPTRWNDPDNALCMAGGPLGGVRSFPGDGKTIVAWISPLTDKIMDSNVGGYLGPYLKYSGFDALCLTGKTDTEIVIHIDGINRNIEVFKIKGLPQAAHRLTEAVAQKFCAGKPRNVTVVTSGTAAKHVRYSILNVSFYDIQRKRHRLKQAGRGGAGMVMTDKGVRAIVVSYDAKQIKSDSMNVAHPDRLVEIRNAYNEEIKTLDPKQNKMSSLGTIHLVPIMNDPAYDLLPHDNYQSGHNPDADKVGTEVYQERFHKGFDGCWMGCTLACAHCVQGLKVKTGPFRGKAENVDGPEYETVGACTAQGWHDPEYVDEFNFYCDIYGIDTISAGVSIAFAMECFERGLINRQQTGMDLSFGNKDSALKLLHQMARGQGFGMIVGQGVHRMKKIFAREFGADQRFLNDIGMEAKKLEFSMYMTKESLAQQGGYGLALKGPQHDEAWLIFEDAVRGNLPNFEDKAEALWWFPMWRRWFGLMGMCKLIWNDVINPSNLDNPQKPLTAPNARAKIPGHVEMLRKFYTAVTGNEVTVDDLLAMSERVYNFQRLLDLRLGYGRRESDSIPYRAMGPVTVEEYESRCDRYDEQLTGLGVDIENSTTEQKIAALREYREDQYRQLQDKVYERRGWTPNGIPTVATVRRLGLDTPEVIALLEANGVTE